VLAGSSQPADDANTGGLMTSGPDVRARRIYDPPTDDDGIRVLVDRLWPRGVSKARAELNEWCAAVAPSDALRTWYGHVRAGLTSSRPVTAASSTSPNEPRRWHTYGLWRRTTG
jgi:hypothetical protein